MKDLSIVFFGTPDFAVESLRALVDAKFNVVAVVTAPDKPAGRGHKLQAPPVKVFAEQHDIPCMQPPNLKASSFIDELRSYKADLQIVVAFRMLPEMVWDMPSLGTYNVHGSLLPNYRGAAPINWAIINGEKETGVTTFKLQHEIDTGNILLQKTVAIEEDDNVGTMHDKLMFAGADLLVKSVELIANDEIVLTPQVVTESVKEAPKIYKETCQINWEDSTTKVHDFIRGLSPFPAAFTSIVLPNGELENWKILKSKKTDTSLNDNSQFLKHEKSLYAKCDNGWLEIVELQVPGKRRMKASEMLPGFRFEIAEVKLAGA